MSMLNNAVSGLNASKAALTSASNNVANAMVKGYSRQQVMTSSVGNDVYGGGVMVDGIRRITEQYEVAQLWNTTSQVGFSTVQASYLRQAEQVFGSEGSDISQGLDQLFASLHSAMEQPDDIAWRQGILNESKALSHRINFISEAVNSQMTQIEGQLSTSVNEINAQLQAIAKFNEEIHAADSKNNAPSTLLDARDAAIDELAAFVDIKVIKDTDNMVKISLSKGQPLLVGTSASTLITSTDPSDPSKSQMSIQFGESHFSLDEATGGSLGALLHYRDNSLAESKTFIDELATTMATEFNSVLAEGKDSNGNTPKDLFIYDDRNPSGSLKVSSDITAEMLALGQDGTPGDNSNLKELVKIAETTFHFSSNGAKTTMGEAFANKIGALGSASRQAAISSNTDLALRIEARSQWSSTSGVNLDEEAVDLIAYQQNYQANAKVIATTDILFQTLLKSI